MAISVGRAGVGTTIESGEITNDSIVDADINSAAAISLSKLSAPTTGSRFHSSSILGAATTANVADTTYYSPVFIPWAVTLTGLVYWVGGTNSGNVAVALYNNSGTRVANRATGTAVGTTSTIQEVAFDSTYAAAAGRYWMGITFSSSSSASYKSGHYTAVGAAAGPGSGANLTSITPPTTATGLAVPVLATY